MMAKKHSHKREVTEDGNEPCDVEQIYDENFESGYTIQDQVTGHYSYYLPDISKILPSQYLQREVDSYLDCNGDG